MTAEPEVTVARTMDDGAPIAGKAGRSGELGADGRRWLSIHSASRVLGVDQSTLRRWSDAGRIPVFRTPGGHRRYAEEDLRAFVGGGPRRQERTRVSRQSLTDRSLSGYEDEYLRAARERRWFRAYGTSRREEHRRLGRRLVDLAVRYAAAMPAAGDRASLLDEARQIGEHYGRAGSNLGLAASETVEAFLYFRQPVVRAVVGMIEEEELPSHRAVRLFAEISHFTDEVLIATVQAHEVERLRADGGTSTQAIDDLERRNQRVDADSG